MTTPNHTSPRGEDAANGATVALNANQCRTEPSVALTANGAIGEREALLADHIELNMCNYDPDDVASLNAWAIRAYDFIDRAALTAEKVAAEPVALVDALMLEAEKFWWNDGPEGKSADAMNAAKQAVIACLAAPQQPAQSAEQDERALTEVGFIVHDDLHGWHFAPTVAWTYLGKGRALYALATETNNG